MRRIAIVAFSCLALGGCAGSSGGSGGPPDTSAGAYSADLQGSLMGACTGNGATDTECTCELKALEQAEPASQVGDTQDAGATMASDAQQLTKQDPGAFAGGCP